MDIQQGSQIEADVLSVAYGGSGVIKYQGQTGFVDDVIHGESITARVRKIKKTYFEADLVRVIIPSSERIPPLCPYFTQCGGCVYQHIPAGCQLKIKEKQLVELLSHIGKISTSQNIHLVSSPESFEYRNSVTIKINRGRTGFTGRQNQSFIPIDSCLLAKPAINSALAQIREDLIKNPSPEKINGEIIIKCGDDNIPVFAFKESVTEKPGRKMLSQTINGITYYFSISTFFQTNPGVLPGLLEKLKCLLDLSPETTLFDLYCGTGLFSIYFSPYVNTAYGIESNQSAVHAARATAKANNIKNARFYHGAIEEHLKTVYENNYGKNNIVIADPPRKGLDNHAMAFFKAIRPDTLVYVSCDPAALARDLSWLLGYGYLLQDIILIDMFPQTKHMETIAILKTATTA